jgi:amino acid transporter
MSRERLVPARLGTVGSHTGAPVGGSLVQSGVGLAVIVGCTLFGIDPMALFLVLAALAAVGIMSLLAVNGWAAWRFFARGRGGPGTVPTRLKVVPLLGAAAMVGVVATTVGNLHSMTGAEPGSWQVWLLPAIVAAVAVAGLVWGSLVAVRHRSIADGIGQGETEPLAVLEHHLVPDGSRL